MSIDSFSAEDHALNILETDLAIASALYTVLVGYVREAPERRLTYGALLNDAKARFPNSDPVRMAIITVSLQTLKIVRSLAVVRDRLMDEPGWLCIKFVYFQLILQKHADITQRADRGDSRGRPN